MKLSAVFVSVYFASTASALPVATGNAELASRNRDRPIIDHRPVDKRAEVDIGELPYIATPTTDRVPSAAVASDSAIESVVDSDASDDDNRVPLSDIELKRGPFDPVHPLEPKADTNAKWGMPIIDHIPVPGTKREASPQDDIQINKKLWMPIIDHQPVPRTKREASSDEIQINEKLWMPIIDHQPVPRTKREASSDDIQINEKLWMPIIDHQPVPGTKREASPDDIQINEKLWMPIIDHQPVPGTK